MLPSNAAVLTAFLSFVYLSAFPPASSAAPSSPMNQRHSTLPTSFLKGIVESVIQKRGQPVEDHPKTEISHRNELLKKHNNQGPIREIAEDGSLEVPDRKHTADTSTFKAATEDEKAERTYNAAQEVERKHNKLERLGRVNVDHVREAFGLGRHNQASTSTQKRGINELFASKKSQGSSHTDSMLEKQKANARESREQFASEHGEADTTTPSTAREELAMIHHLDGDGFTTAAKGQARVKHLDNLKRVDMLEKGDWKGMQQEAARLHEQSKQHQGHILNAKLASQYKSGKAKIWQDIAQEKPGAFDRARQFIHTPKEYREKAIAIAKNPDPSGMIDIESFRKNKLREAAMKTGDKDLLEDVSRGYKADAAIYGVVSHVLNKDSVNLKKEQNDWLKAVDEAKKKQDAEKKRVSKGWLEHEMFPEPQFKVSNVDVKMQPMIKKGVYEKPSYSKYSSKYHTRKEEALAAAEAAKGQAFRYPPEADEATRKKVIYEKPNGPLLYQADRLARKTENNSRKMYAVLFRGADRSKAEAARAKELKVKHQEEERVHGIKARRSKVLQNVWEYQANGNVEKIPNLLEKLTSSHIYAHEADHFHRKALRHGRELARFSKEEQDTHPKALMHAEKKRFNLLRHTALLSGDKSLAQDVALRYVAKNAAHRDLEEKAKMEKKLYEKKARDWDQIANEKQLEIEFDERLKHDQDERKKKEGMAKKKQAVEKEEKPLKKRSTEMEVPLLNKEAENSTRAAGDKQKGKWKSKFVDATSSYKAFLRRAKDALAQRPRSNTHEDSKTNAGKGKQELNNQHQLGKMLARQKDTIDSEGAKPKTKGSVTETKKKRRLRHPYQTPGGRGPNMSYYRRGGFSSYTRAQDNDSKDLLHDKILLLSSNVEAQKLKMPAKGSLMARLMEVSGRKYRY